MLSSFKSLNVCQLQFKRHQDYRVRHISSTGLEAYFQYGHAASCARDSCWFSRFLHSYTIPQWAANLRATRDTIISDVEQRTDDSNASLTLLEIRIPRAATSELCRVLRADVSLQERDGYKEEEKESFITSSWRNAVVTVRDEFNPSRHEHETKSLLDVSHLSPSSPFCNKERY